MLILLLLPLVMLLPCCCCCERPGGGGAAAAAPDAAANEQESTGRMSSEGQTETSPTRGVTFLQYMVTEELWREIGAVYNTAVYIPPPPPPMVSAALAAGPAAVLRLLVLRLLVPRLRVLPMLLLPLAHTPLAAARAKPEQRLEGHRGRVRRLNAAHAYALCCFFLVLASRLLDLHVSSAPSPARSRRRSRTRDDSCFTQVLRLDAAHYPLRQRAHAGRAQGHPRLRAAGA